MKQGSFLWRAAFLGTAFGLSSVTGVVIEGMKIRHYRFNGILITSGSGNRIIKNVISNTLSNGIDVQTSSGNLFWKNEICNCSDGIRFIAGSTHNWVIDNIVKDCVDDGFECFLGVDSNNVFISNKAIGNAGNSIELFGSNNLAFNNILIDNSNGIFTNSGSDTVAIGNVIKDCRTNTVTVTASYSNLFMEKTI
ncbi:MAG TPA: hypothetical protein GX505_04890 [Clostridiales bacterium]|nr:hypothetical protein [Clostridiales bacterium]